MFIVVLFMSLQIDIWYKLKMTSIFSAFDPSQSLAFLLSRCSGGKFSCQAFGREGIYLIWTACADCP